LRVTIKKIAEIANVSRGTVDKVLHNRGRISPAVKQKVLEIAKSLNYKPNMAAKYLHYNKKPALVGVILPSENSNFFVQVKQGINKVAEEVRDFGFKVECISMQTFDDVKEQLRLIDYFKSKEISGLVLVPIDVESIREKLDELTDANISIVTIMSDILNSKRLCFVGQDYIHSGKVAGDLIGKLLKGEGNIGIVIGSFNMLGHKQRFNGFKDVLEKRYEKIEIVNVIENHDEDMISFEKTVAMLTENENINGIYIVGAGVKGTCQAVKVMNKQRIIKIVSHDLIPETVELVKDGLIDFTIGQDPEYQGYKSVQVLFDYLFNKKPVIDDFIKTKTDIRTIENIDFG
jgi:LacI family transcriptional regulator